MSLAGAGAGDRAGAGEERQGLSRGPGCNCCSVEVEGVEEDEGTGVDRGYSCLGTWNRLQTSPSLRPTLWTAHKRGVVRMRREGKGA